MAGGKIIELIRQHAQDAALQPTLELATVTNDWPALRIRIDNMGVELDKDFLIVAEHLTEHTRKVSFDWAVGGLTEFAGGPTHQHPQKTLTGSQQTVTIHNQLTKGTRVIVQATGEAQKYIVIAKAVE